MVDAEVDNLGMRSSRRAKFNVGVTYETSKSQIKKITRDIKKIIDEHGTRFGLCSAVSQICFFKGHPLASGWETWHRRRDKGLGKVSAKQIW